MSEHDWFRDHLDLYVTGGLTADESVRAERHAASCAACAQELAQRRLREGELRRLCAPVHFAGDWDQRVQARWSRTHRPPRPLPASMRWALGAAAVLLVGAVGAGMNALAQEGMIVFPGGDTVVAGLFTPGEDVMAREVTDELVDLVDTSRTMSEADAKRTQAQNNLKQLEGALQGRAKSVKDDSPAIRRGYSQSPGASNDNFYFHNYSPAPNVPSSHSGVSGPGLLTSDEAVGIRDGDAVKRIEGLKELAPDLADGRMGRMGGVKSGKAPSHGNQDKTLGDLPKDVAKETTKLGGQVNGPTPPPVAAGDVQFSDQAEQASLAKMKELRTGAEYFKVATATDGKSQEQASKQLELAAPQKGAGKGLGAQAGFGMQPARPQDAKKEEAKKEAAKDGPGPVAAGQPQPEPQIAQRKIIRTGDLEFEVSVFDDTVAQITKLIGAIPGAFVATVNSEKLPNGKVKGSVVVRVPPEALDKFVLDLRQALAKTGELKSQKIGSADVTKQYTDIESRLRAARTMEERLLAIIKTGKGEVKDLVAAERELGVWRTKIEEMEGEIRYYNTQVGLSTLTITVYEKEIRAAAAMVITEHVTMKIEADDVEKSLQTALLAVTEAKGRVSKSDLKQHAAGQLEAVLSFEVAPAQAGAVKEKLKGLGIVTHHDAQRLQQAEGGAAPTGDIIKSRTDDVRFDVTLYNVANIQPREAYVLQVVVSDVPAEYRKLLDAVAAAKGQVRVSQLDEKDRTNTFAQLDFDVPAPQRELFDKVVAGLGDVVSRNTTRAGPGESATDRKVGYRLTLKSEASVPPRETFTLHVYSLDVPATYRKLQESAAQLKGLVRAQQLNEQDKNNISAQFDVDVPRGDMATLDKLLDEAGEVASRSTSRVQPSEIATDRKVGYRLTLRSQVPPRETLDLNIEVADVEGSATALAALVKSAKGRVAASEVTQDAAGKSVAIQLFDVPLAAKEALASQFKALGKVRGQKTAQNLQAPDGKLATAHLNVRLTNVTPIVPSDDGVWPQVRRSLSYAFTLLSVSLMFLIVGVSVLLPWALLVWVGVKVVRRLRNKGQATA